MCHSHLEGSCPMMAASIKKANTTIRSTSIYTEMRVMYPYKIIILANGRQ
jgi:hypothetical protein